MDYILKILRTLFFSIDRVVYEGIGNVYDLLLRIARTSIFNSNTIEGFYEKIYALIGIFMLFKISFSLITYILNPDDFSDKDKGFASIVKRVILSLVMLVIVPFGFQEAYELQTIILEDNTLAALIFSEAGVDNDEEATYKIDTAGDKIKFILMFTFFQPNYNEIYQEEGDESISACAVTYKHKENGAVEVGDASSDTPGTFILNPECFGNLENGEYDPSSTFGQYWEGKEDLYQTYAQGVARQNFYLMFKHDIAMLQTEGEKGPYVVDYMSPLSTAVGVATLWLLLLFCIDIAVRSVKLGFYELIAPIPILSYIDPKTKDGMLNKWFNQVVATYLSLFIRLLALYLAIFIIYSVAQNGIVDVVTGERITDWWVIIFIIIGTLMFAKQLPNILKDVLGDTLGIKGTGDFTLNPLKKMEKEMLGAKTIGKVGKTGLGIAGGVGVAAGVGAAGLLTGQGLRFGAMGKALAGGFRGEKLGKNFASSYGAGRARKKQLDQMRADGVSPWSVRGDKLYNAFHGETRAERIQHAIDGMKSLQTQYESYEKTSVGVDAYAKFADKQAKAAAARGDYTEQKMWEDAKDNRIKEIHANGGEIVRSTNLSEAAMRAAMIGPDPITGQIGALSSFVSRGDQAAEVNAALANLAGTMQRMADSMNSAYANIEGYQEISATADPKSMKNQALGSQQSMETNAENIHRQDTAKYSGSSKK